jgi:hypothetical protein
MRSMLAPLSPHEEATLRRIGFGTEGELDTRCVRRLLQLDLIEWSGWTWRLTAFGRQRYASLVDLTQTVRGVERSQNTDLR